MPDRLPYLHPSQRNLRTEQIGPSSHKNEFRPGVLIGDWNEAKTAANVISVQPKLQTRTINRNSYYGIPADPALFSRPQEYTRDLLFGHSGFDATAHPQSENLTRTEKKKQEWERMRDPDVFRVLATTTTTKTLAYKGAEHKSDVKPSEYSVKGEFRKQMKYLTTGSLHLRS